jgi:hypothetical protein
MLEEEHYGPAVVVGQAAVEIGMETAVSFGLRADEVPDALQTWIEESTVGTWSPTSQRVQRLWPCARSREPRRGQTRGKKC